jgi:hypothetical protein
MVERRRTLQNIHGEFMMRVLVAIGALIAWTGVAGFGAMYVFKGAILLRRRRPNALMDNAELQPVLVQEREPGMAAVANGTPLAARMARGSPYSRNTRLRFGFAVSHFVERSPRHVNRLRNAKSA